MKKEESISEPYAYLSYCRGDKSIARQLWEELNYHANTWVAFNSIRPGHNWAQETQKAANNAEILVIIISKNSTKSKRILNEIDLFLKKDKPILGIKVDDTPIEIFPKPVQDLLYVDLKDGYSNALSGAKFYVSSNVPQTETESAETSPLESEPQTSKGYVFISYAEKDSQFVVRLKDFMEEQGYSYWEYRESDRDYHSPLSTELEEVIGEAAATLSVLSNTWKTSKWAIREYFFSEDIGKPVFLLRIEEMEPTLAIAGIPYIDFVADKGAGFTKLAKELKRKGL